MPLICMATMVQVNNTNPACVSLSLIHTEYRAISIDRSSCSVWILRVCVPPTVDMEERRKKCQI